MAANQQETIISQLALFEKTPILLSVEDCYWEVCNTKTALDGTSNQLVFTIPSDAQAYTALNETYLYLTCQLVKADGTALGDTAQIAPVQHPATAIFQSLDIYLNDSRITPYSNNFAYINWFHGFCQTEAAKNSYLQLGLWYPDSYDSAEHFNQANPYVTGDDAKSNKGLKRRAEWFKGSKEVKLITKLYTPPHNITKHMLNRVKLDYVFTLNPKTFFIMSTMAEADFVFKINAAKLFVKRVLPSPAVQIAHEKILNTRNAQYNTKFFSAKTHNIPINSYDFIWENVFQQDILPTSLYVGVVKAGSKSGALNANPFDFRQHQLTNLICYLGSKKISNIDYTLDQADKKNQEALWQTYEAMGYLSSNSGPFNLNRDSFCTSACIVGFNLTRDGNTGAAYNNASFTSDHIRLEGKFKAGTTEALTLVCWGLVAGILEVNRMRQAIVNYKS